MYLTRKEFNEIVKKGEYAQIVEESTPTGKSILIDGTPIEIVEKRGGRRSGAGRKREGEKLKVTLSATISAESYRKVKEMYGRGEFGRVLDDFIRGL